jgi:hypothetical protein
VGFLAACDGPNRQSILLGTLKPVPLFWSEDPMLISLYIKFMNAPPVLSLAMDIDADSGSRD